MSFDHFTPTPTRSTPSLPIQFCFLFIFVLNPSKSNLCCTYTLRRMENALAYGKQLHLRKTDSHLFPQLSIANCSVARSGTMPTSSFHAGIWPSLDLHGSCACWHECWVPVCICPAVSGGHCSLIVTHHLQLLSLSTPFLFNDP